MTASSPTTDAGNVQDGTIAVSSVTVPASSLASSWQNNGPNNTIFPAGEHANPVRRWLDASSNAQNPNPVSDPAPCNVSAVDRNFRNPYVTNWTLGIQHAFTANLSLDVAYVGNHGARLPGMRDINQGHSKRREREPAEFLPASPMPRQYPYLGFIDVLSNLYVSNYNGLQTTLTERTSHGLSFTAGYTYSHALDNDSYNISPFLPQDSTHPESGICQQRF